MLFDLRIDNESLQLPDDFRVDIESFHPFEGKDEIAAAYTIPWTLPDVPTNQRILQHANCIELKQGSRSFDAILFYGGNNHKSGKLVVHEDEWDIESGSIMVDFYPDGFTVDLFGKNLRDLAWAIITMGTTTADVLAHALATASLSYPATDYVFPMIKATDFYGSSNPDFSGVLNKFNVAGGVYYGNSSTNNHALAPQMFMMAVLKKIFSGYQLRGDFVNDTDDQQMLLFSDFALDLKENKGYVKAVQTTTQYADPSDIPAVDYIFGVHDEEIEDVSNTHNTTNGKYTTVATGWHRFNWSGYYKNTATTPGINEKIYIELWDGASVITSHVINTSTGTTESRVNRYFLVNLGMFPGADIQMRIKFTIEVDDGFGNYVEELCQGEAWDCSWEIINTSSANLNVYAKEINLRNLVPDMKISKFLVELKKLGFCFSANFFTREVRIDYVKRQFNGQEEDWTTRATDKVKLIKSTGDGYSLNFNFPTNELFSEDDELPDVSLFNRLDDVDTLSAIATPTLVNDYCLVKDQNAFYRVWLNTGTNDVEWIFWFYNYYPKVFGAGKEEINTDFSPMVMTEIAYSSKTFLVPQFSGTGSSAAFEIGVRKPPLKLMYWKGMQASSSGNYPFATSLNMKYGGTILGNKSIRLDDAVYGLGIKNGLDKWFTALTFNAIVHMMLTLQEEDISKLDFLISIRIGFNIYALLELNSTYTNDVIELSECRFLKLN